MTTEYYYKLSPMEQFHCSSTRASTIKLEVFKETTVARRLWWDKVVEERVDNEMIHKHPSENIPQFIIRAHKEAKNKVKAQRDPMENEHERDYIHLKKELAVGRYDFVEALMGDEISE